MCRLYGLQATHPTKVGCELTRAQNALIRQSIRDQRGFANPDGWGIGYRTDTGVTCEREVEPASDSEEFRRISADVRSRSLIAHIRRATVGRPKLTNTHPFRDGDALLAHNGHIGNFDEVRPRMLEQMTDAARAEIDGSTDSEHILGLLMSRRARRSEADPLDLLRGCIRDVERWAREAGGEETEVAMNILWMIDGELVGARYGRSLWYIERDQPHRCEVCGDVHADVGAGESYRVAEFASERITSEEWQPVPRDTVFVAREDAPVRFEAIDGKG